MSAPNPDPEDYQLDTARGYGETIPLTQSGDMRTNALARFSVLEGPEVVVQRIKVAFLTPLGSSPMAPEFGFDWFVIGEPREVVEAEIRRCVEHDPDVLTVTDITYEEADPDPPVSRPWPIAHITADLTNSPRPIDFSVELSALSGE